VQPTGNSSQEGPGLEEAHLSVSYSVYPVLKDIQAGFLNCLLIQLNCLFLFPLLMAVFEKMLLTKQSKAKQKKFLTKVQAVTFMPPNCI